MKPRRLVVFLSLAMVATLALAPATALAQRSHGGPGGGGGHAGAGGRGHGSHHPGFRPHHGFRHGHHRGHHQGRHHGVRPFYSSGAVSVYAPPVLYSGADYPPAPVYATDYALPPVYGLPAVGTGSVTLAPAPPTVIEYPHGRYELRGDGVATPYGWVWVPNPPPAPPPPTVPPAAPPAAPLPAEPSASEAPRSRSRDVLYRWTDEGGVAHWTNRPDAVPPRYRTYAPPAPDP